MLSLCLKQVFHFRCPRGAWLPLLALSMAHCLPSVVKAQGEANNWYFGVNAGLTFNTDPPTALTDGKLNTYEGCSTISDKSGKLLFYTDGRTVYNKKHQVMPNGGGLKGHGSAAQSAVVIPRPGSTTNYIVITIPVSNIADGNGFSMRYSEVDMRLDGGLGDVLPENKNTKLLPYSSERLAVVRHANGLWYWIVGRNQGKGINRNDGRDYYAYLMDCNGVNTEPVVSADVATIDSEWNSGYLVLSPDGKRLVSTSRASGVEIADFDTSTGKVSGNQKVSAQKGGNWYGAAFSPDGQRLYATHLNTATLYQWDMAAADIPASQVLIGNTPGKRLATGYKGGALQLGPDGKIYMVEHGLPSLGVINSPNALGKDCDYAPSAIDLNGREGRLGLPPFVSSFFTEPKKIAVGGETMPGKPLRFSLEGAGVFERMEWDFGDGTKTTTYPGSPGPEHTYGKNGMYTVQVVVHGSNCSLTERFSAQVIVGAANRLVTSADTAICAGGSAAIKVSGGDGLGYRWSHNLGTAAKRTVSPAGTTTYTVRTKVRTGTNLVTNGDFEQGDTGFDSEYVYQHPIATPRWGKYDIVDGKGADCPKQGQIMEVDGASSGANSVPVGASFWCQTVTVQPNTDYVFSYSFADKNGEAYPAPKIVPYVDGRPVGDIHEAKKTGKKCVWRTVHAVWRSGSGGVAEICLKELSGVGNGADFYLDDISVYRLTEVSASVKVTVNPKKTPTFSGIPASVCQGSPAPKLPATSDNGVSGTWHPATVDVSAPGTKSHVFTPNAGECATSKTVKITINPKPVVTLKASKTIICTGEAVTLTAGGAKTYAWDNGLGSGGTKTASPTGTTTYTVTGTDGNGCTNTASVKVTVNPKKTPTFSGIPASVCHYAFAPKLPTTSDNGVSGTWHPATVDVSAPGTKSHVFTPNAGECAVPVTVNIVVNPLKTPTFAPIPILCQGSVPPPLPTTSQNGVSGTWIPRVIDTSKPFWSTSTFTPNAGECAVRATLTAFVRSGPTITVASSAADNAICAGGSATLTAGGAAAYAWDKDLGSGETKTASPTVTTTYTVTGTDGNGCQGTASITITVNPKPDVRISAPESVCSGTLVIMLASGASDYDWYEDGKLIGYKSHKRVVPYKTATYSVTGTDDKGCQNTASQTIVVNPKPVVTLSMDRTVICPGDVVTLTASGADTYIWTGEGTSGNGPVQKVSPTRDASYDVIGKLNNGCEDRAVLL